MGSLGRFHCCGWWTRIAVASVPRNDFHNTTMANYPFALAQETHAAFRVRMAILAIYRALLYGEGDGVESHTTRFPVRIAFFPAVLRRWVNTKLYERGLYPSVCRLGGHGRGAQPRFWSLAVLLSPHKMGSVYGDMYTRGRYTGLSMQCEEPHDQVSGRLLDIFTFSRLENAGQHAVGCEKLKYMHGEVHWYQPWLRL